MGFEGIYFFLYPLGKVGPVRSGSKASDSFGQNWRWRPDSQSEALGQGGPLPLPEATVGQVAEPGLQLGSYSEGCALSTQPQTVMQWN